MPKFDIPAGVLATPPTRTGGGASKKKVKAAPKEEAKAQNKSIADLLGLGNSRRKIAKKGKRGLRPKGTDWSLDDMGGLFRRSSALADTILVALSSMNEARAQMPKKKSAPTMREARQATIDAIRKSNNPAGTIGARARGLLQRIAKIANESGVHPLDVTATLVSAAGNQAAAEGYSIVDTYRQLRNSQAIPLKENVQIMRSIRRSATSRLSGGGVSLFNAAAKMIRGFGGSLFEGIVTQNGRPWTRKAGPIHGAEIIEFEYMIPSIADDGSVANWTRAVGRHETAAMTAEKAARGSRGGSADQHLKGLLQKTPCGRIWLCWSPKSGGMFIASDRQPSRRIFLSYERSKLDAALKGQSPSKHISGFTV